MVVLPLLNPPPAYLPEHAHGVGVPQRVGQRQRARVGVRQAAQAHGRAHAQHAHAQLAARVEPAALYGLSRNSVGYYGAA